LVVDPLTAKLLAGEVRDGSDVRVDAKAGEVVLTVSAPKGAGRAS
jgi:hypothetical protein